MVLGSSPVPVTYTSDIGPAWRKEFLDIQATMEWGFTLKRVRDMTRIYCQMHCRDKYPQHSSIIRPVWPNGWVFFYELSGSGFETSCSHFSFRFGACFEQEIPWHSDIYIVRIHSETRTWHGKNIQSNAPYRYILRRQLNHLAYLANWLCVPLGTKWFWVWDQLQSLQLQIWCLLWARNPLTLRYLYSADSLWNAYLTWQEHTIKCTVQINTKKTAQSFGHFGQLVVCSFRN